MYKLNSPINLKLYSYKIEETLPRKDYLRLALLISFARKVLIMEKVSEKSKLFKTFFDPFVSVSLVDVYKASNETFIIQARMLTGALILAIEQNYRKIVDPFVYVPRLPSLY